MAERTIEQTTRTMPLAPRTIAAATLEDLSSRITSLRELHNYSINNGFASNFFLLQRGVRQGCPLSGLLFVLAIEVLGQAIRKNENIRGLKINDTELKLSMYADDITAFIKDDCSVNHLFNLLNDFGACSGLKINISKTKGMWLGSLKGNLGKRSPFNISWPEKYVIALGVAFAYDPFVSYKVNFEEI